MNPKGLLTISENVPLGPLTTLKVGGPARFFVEAGTEEDVRRSVAYAAAHGLDVLILGGGSNILVSDAGFDGLVVHVALTGISCVSSASSNEGLEILTVQAGEVWDGFVEYCVGRDLAGIECLSGIPGSVGGTPVQNVGAYGQEVSETIVSVRCLDRESLEVVELPNSACGFSYRTSIFNSSVKDRYVVLAVTFALAAGGEPRIGYKDLRDHFAHRSPTLAETREAVLRIRASKSMVIDPDDPNCRSAGSFFKNPIVDRSRLDEIAAAAGVEVVPHFEAGPGLVKIPAAWLIERAGFAKGFTMGEAAISTKHSLAIVNRGRASAAEILALKDRIVGEVEARYGLRLVPEPVFIGFGQEKA